MTTTTEKTNKTLSEKVLHLSLSLCSFSDPCFCGLDGIKIAFSLPRVVVVVVIILLVYLQHARNTRTRYSLSLSLLNKKVFYYYKDVCVCVFACALAGCAFFSLSLLAQPHTRKKVLTRRKKTKKKRIV